MADKYLPGFSKLTESEKRALIGSLLAKEGHLQGTDIRGFHKFLALLGLPAESNPQALARFPIVTVVTIALTAMISFLCFSDTELFMSLAFIPSELWRAGGLTLLSCFLVHGSWFHLFSNMYALFVFGDNVEDTIGRTRFLLLLITATLAASLFSGYTSGYESIPHVGASGGVFGVIVFYLLRFPKAKFTYAFFFHFFQLPAAAVLGIYALTQLMGGLKQMAGIGEVDHVAHIAGGVVGFVFWIVYGRSNR